MKVAIFTEDLYEDLEFWYPYYRLKEAGHVPVVVGSGRRDMFCGKHGIENKVDVSIDRIDPNDFGAVVVPGGYAPDKMRLQPKFSEFIRQLYDHGKVIASICHGPWMLVSAGIVKGKKMTCWPSLKDDLMNAGARYMNEEVIVDGNIITSRSPEDLPAFMRELLKALSEQGSSREEVLVAGAAGGM